MNHVVNVLYFSSIMNIFLVYLLSNNIIMSATAIDTDKWINKTIIQIYWDTSSP